MSEKQFLKMPQPDFGLYSGYTHRDDVVREMRDKYEALVAHVEEENSDLAEAAELLLSRANKAEARIRELTEWRPMSEAPKDGTRILLRAVVWGDVYILIGYFCTNPRRCVDPYWVHEGIPGQYNADDEYERIRTGWLPLPEVSRG